MDVAAVILAAGAGSRLGALGRRYSKPMVPLAGRPLIDWAIATLRTAAVRRIVVVGHPSDQRLAAFLRARHSDIGLVLQPERRGIADALRCALPQIATERGYVACACDSLFAPDDLRVLIECGAHHIGAAAVGVLDMGVAATTTRSGVRLEGDRVAEIVEKPAPGTLSSGLVAMPLYWLPQSFAPYLDAPPTVGNESYISTALNAFVIAGGAVRAVFVKERLEITTAEDIAPAAARLRVLPET